MFRDMLALATNPFGPTFQATPENLDRLEYLSNLDREPLRLDACDEQLRPLFCTSILDFDAHLARFRDLMTDLGYELDGDGRRSLDSAFIVIRGALGSGKTTLGAWMIAEMTRLPGTPWKQFHLPELSQDTDEARSTMFSELSKSVNDIPRGSHIAVLIDNITGVGLKAAIEFYESLRAWPRLFVVTTHNIKLLDADERTMGGTARIEVFTIRDLKASDADDYVAHRLPLYRDPKRPEIDALSPIFPFQAGQPGSYVRSGSAQSSIPIVLRQLNAHFRGRLAQHARHLRSSGVLQSLDSAPVDSLPNYLLPEL